MNIKYQKFGFMRLKVCKMLHEIWNNRGRKERLRKKKKQEKHWKYEKT